jgi:hypothetical protein
MPKGEIRCGINGIGFFGKPETTFQRVTTQIVPHSITPTDPATIQAAITNLEQRLQELYDIIEHYGLLTYS